MRVRKRQELKRVAFALVAGLCLSLACVGLCMPQQADAKAKAANGIHKVNGSYYFYQKGAPVTNTWKTVGAKRYYFGKDGKAQTGLSRVKGAWYCFNEKGVMQKGSGKKLTQTRKVKAGAWTYFLNNKYQLEARKKGSTYYYNNGDAMTSADKKDYTTWIIAQGIASKVTKKSDSHKTKRLKVFKWVMAGYYKMWRNFSQRPDWPAIYAMDHFKHRCGDCNSDGAAFTYLAAAIGDEAYVCLITTRSVNAAHAWCEIDGREYDPLFAQAKSFSKYYGGKKSTPVVRIKIPYFSPTHVNGQGWVPGRVSRSSTKKGLVTTKSGTVYYYEKGKAVTNRWVTAKGKTYYFGANGKAVTGSKKLKPKGGKKKAYFVFGDNCALKKGSATRIVTANGTKYRVSAKGRAVPGWLKGANGSRRAYFFADGHRAQGIVVVKGKLCCFSAKGTYEQGTTKKLRAAVKAGKSKVNTGAPASKSAASSASDTAASEEAASKAAKAEAKRLKKLAKQAKATARLLRLMGTPVSTLHQNSCLVDGATDWLYTFEHVTIQTLKTSDAETLYAVSKAG